jgi:aryl-alcohol dehydrogenase-like predicted oxidoreductase
VEERQLGTSGIAVSRIILGCGNFGGIGSAPAFFGQGESREEAFALMDDAWEQGVTTFDTADAYGGGSSETWIGEWLKGRGPEVRDRVVLSTKVFHSVEGDPADHGLAPARVRRQLEGSLRRLGVERVDMYLTHEPDPDTPLEETLAAMDELVAEGKVGAVGASNVDGPLLGSGLGTYRWAQNSYSLLDREPEREVLPLCREHGLGFTPFGPLAGGWLTGKYRRGEEPPPGSRMATRPEPYLALRNERVYAGIEELGRRAAARGVDAATLAFAWLFAQPEVTAVVVGPRRPEHLEPAVRSLDLRLDDAEAAELARLFEPGPVDSS